MAKEEFYKSPTVEGEALADHSTLNSLSDQELALEIKKIWENYLGQENISNHQSFFDVGGDSVLAVSVYQALCEKFNVSLNPYVFYTDPTIHNILKSLRQSQRESADPIKRKKDPDPAGKSPSQSAGGTMRSLFSAFSIQNKLLEVFLKTLKLKNKIVSLLYRKNTTHRGPQSPQQKSFVFMKQIFNETYNGCFSVPIQSALDQKEFQQALQLIIHSQESLRTLFIGEEQILLPEYPQEILFYNLKSHSEEEQKKIIKQTEEKLLKQKFNFSSLPLFKLALFHLSKKKSHFIFCINHIIGDGWSLQAFLSELNKSYAFLNKQSTALDLHSYLDYTKKYKIFCRENFKSNQIFWNNQLAKLHSFNISSKFQEAESLTTEENLRLDKKLAEKVSSYSQKHKTQDFYLYLALWSESLKEFLNCSNICFWTTYHGRDFPFKGIHTMIGSIARTAPLFIELHTKERSSLLKTVRKAYLQTLAHKDFNIVKHFLSNKNKNISNNWIGFNYLDFKPLASLTKELPFSMDLNQANVRLSSSQQSYKRVYLFFSVHNYRHHLDLRVYGKASTGSKKQVLNLMKSKLEQLSV